jgi:leader peptidase (prepilin peptidase)/N-methyltransferase
VSFLGLSRELATVWWGVVGLCVGSFLNVAIYRLPRDDVSVAKPARSFCPSCKRQLTWSENIPLFSWALQRARCRGCGARVSWRYPAVELLTALLWALVAWHTAADTPLLLVRVLVISGLIVATFVDFDCFEIPDEVSIGGMVAAPLLCLLVPQIHADAYIAHQWGGGELTRVGALLTCGAGMALGGGILLAIGWAGSKAFGREAMGFGDVKLLCAAGGFIGPGGVLVALVIASFAGAIIGLSNIARLLLVARRRTSERGTRRSFGRSLRAARLFGQMLPFGPYLALGTGITLLYWDHVIAWLLP